jgi:hypothetical protein
VAMFIRFLTERRVFLIVMTHENIARVRRLWV